jgi:hypothetical protein
VVGVERFGDVDVELRFFPYRGAIRKARRGEKIFPRFPDRACSLDSIFRELWNIGFQDSLKALKHVWNLHFRVSRSAQTNFGILRSATHSLLALEHPHQLNVQLPACKPLLHDVMGIISMLLGRASKSETLSSASKINITLQ